MDQGERQLPTPGLVLPSLTLPASDGSSVCLATLRQRIVIAVYPWTGRPGQPNPPNWDDIPGAHGSTPELEGFRDLYDRFASKGVDVFGLSRQATAYQREAAERLKLPFRILSDFDAKFSEVLSLPHFSTGGVSYLKRLTLVAHEGRLEWVFYPVLDPAGHAAEVLDWLKQYS